MNVSNRQVFMVACVAVAAASFALAPVAEAAGGHRGGGGGGHHGGGSGGKPHVGGGGGGHPGGGGAHRPNPGSGQHRVDPRANQVRNTSVNNINHNVHNRNTNVNVNRNVNIDVDHHGGCCGWDNDYHPIATAAAVSATVAVTSAVVGSMVRSVPPSCVPVNYGGIIYQQCGSTWYQPQAGQYIVINPPY